jgi:hypothetical protein
VGKDCLNVHITKYYKKLFEAPAPSNFSMREEVNQDLPQLTPKDNDILTANFTEKEVYDAIFQMELNKAPVPNFLLELFF